jgi:predicted Zn finger-like uncharacterized protein
MILVCPSCDARYNLVQAIEPPGRRVRCRKCAHIWFADSSPESQGAEAQPHASPPAATYMPPQAPPQADGHNQARAHYSEAQPATPAPEVHIASREETSVGPAWPPVAPSGYEAPVAASQTEHHGGFASEAAQESLSSMYAREQGRPTEVSPGAALIQPISHQEWEQQAVTSPTPTSAPTAFPWPSPPPQQPVDDGGPSMLARSAANQSPRPGRPRNGQSRHKHSNLPWPIRLLLGRPQQGSATRGNLSVPSWLPPCRRRPNPGRNRHSQAMMPGGPQPMAPCRFQRQ